MRRTRVHGVEFLLQQIVLLGRLGNRQSRPVGHSHRGACGGYRRLRTRELRALRDQSSIQQQSRPYCHAGGCSHRVVATSLSPEHHRPN